MRLADVAAVDVAVAAADVEVAAADVAVAAADVAERIDGVVAGVDDDDDVADIGVAESQVLPLLLQTRRQLLLLARHGQEY